MHGRIYSDEEKVNLSEKLSGAKNPFFGKQHNAETKLRMSQAKQDKKGKTYLRRLVRISEESEELKAWVKDNPVRHREALEIIQKLVESFKLPISE